MSHNFAIRQARRAFSILELAVVLGVIALIAGAGINIAGGALKAADRVTTQERLNTIKLALDSFAKAYGYLPCPADRTLTATSANFGIESRTGANCTASGGVINPAPNNVWFGALPVRTLGLPDNYAWDGWNGKLTYAASNGLIAGPTAYTLTRGTITIRDGNRTTSNVVSSRRLGAGGNGFGDGSDNGTGGLLVSMTNTNGITTSSIAHFSHSFYKGSFTPIAVNPNVSIDFGAAVPFNALATNTSIRVEWMAPTTGAIYTVVSHGPDGRGAFAGNGSAIPSSKPCSATAVDGENCNDDAIFFDTAYNDGAQDALYFDDYIISANNDLMRAPVSTSLYTNNTVTTCPAGTCEAWCAACTSNYPGGGTVVPPASLTVNAFLCRKIITSNATTCAAACFWGGVTATDYVKCP